MAVHDLVQRVEPAWPLLTQTPNTRRLGGRMRNRMDNETKKEPRLLVPGQTSTAGLMAAFRRGHRVPVRQAT